MNEPIIAYPTPKGLKRGLYADGAVAITHKEGPYYIGWKVTVHKDGTFSHPAIEGKVSATDPRLFLRSIEGSSSKPTAMILKDSLWRFEPVKN